MSAVGFAQTLALVAPNATLPATTLTLRSDAISRSAISQGQITARHLQGLQQSQYTFIDFIVVSEKNGFAKSTDHNGVWEAMYLLSGCGSRGGGKLLGKPRETVQTSQATADR